MAKKILCGLGVILFGVFVLLGNLDMINFSFEIGVIWPVILILFVLGGIIDNRRVDVGSIIVLFFGLYFLLRNVGFISVSFWRIIFPIIIILIGLAILLPKKNYEIINNEELKLVKNDIMLNAIFSSTGAKSQSKELKKIESTAIFGATKIDLKNADAANGKCICDVNCIFGGTDILLSDDWEVNTDGLTSIMGGCENKHQYEEKKSKAKNTLYLKGIALFGGIDIK